MIDKSNLRGFARYQKIVGVSQPVFLNIYESEDGRFYIQIDWGKIIPRDGEMAPFRAMVPGSDRTLEMAKQGARAIVQNVLDAPPDFRLSWES